MNKIRKNILTGFAFAISIFGCISCAPPEISAYDIDGLYNSSPFGGYGDSEIRIANGEGTVVDYYESKLTEYNYEDIGQIMAVCKDNATPYLIEIKNTGDLTWSCYAVAFDYFDYYANKYWYNYFPATITVSSKYPKDGKITIKWTDSRGSNKDVSFYRIIE
ncbi:MAG: hypothetical protein LBN95_09115 [Prevotellaceae bacterium]|jgi:hypothetical protein|nr:hypothetical protein [Prevotellaceae bacterium]